MPTGSHVWVIEVDIEPEAIGSMLAIVIGRAKAWSTTSPVISRTLIPKVQSPEEGGVNQTLLGEGTLLPVVMSNTTESVSVLLT